MIWYQTKLTGFMIDYSNILQIDSIMDNAAFKMMLLSIRSDSNNNNNLSLPSQSNVSTKEQIKSYDNNNNNNEDQDYFI